MWAFQTGSKPQRSWRSAIITSNIQISAHLVTRQTASDCLIDLRVTHVRHDIIVWLDDDAGNRPGQGQSARTDDAIEVRATTVIKID